MSRNRIIAALCALLPVAAQAHTGADTHAHFMQGLMHPVTGWDHLVVLLSLGVLAAGAAARTRVLCAPLLMATLGGGAALGLAWPQVPFVEPAILLTVLACAGMLMFRERVHAAALMCACMAFAFIHGIAHGQEAPAGDLAGYFAGFALAGVALYGVGLLAGIRLRARLWPQKAPPITSRQPGRSPASR